MKKKMLIFTVLVVLVASVLVGCSMGEDNSETRNNDSNQESTGKVQEMVTEAATKIKDAVDDIME